MNISIPRAESSDMTPLAATETGRLRGTRTIPEIGGACGRKTAWVEEHEAITKPTDEETFE